MSAKDEKSQAVAPPPGPSERNAGGSTTSLRAAIERPAPSPAPRGAPPAVAYADERRSFLRSRGTTPFEILIVTLLAAAILVPGIWSYTLVDPWETHYAEVGRRMLQDDDWVHLDWQNEGFRSKPVLTFWLIAGGLQATGVGDDGGYSGEMVASAATMFAVRIPFVLFGIFGLVMVWFMLARLVSRRTAWLGFLVVGTTPLFILVSRQAITDITLVGCLLGAMACFAMATEDGERPLSRLWRGFDGFHVFLLVLGLLIGWQAIYYGNYFWKYPTLAAGVRFPSPHIVIPAVMLLGYAAFVVWAVVLQPTRTTGQVYMYWFYTLLSISALGKGPPGLGIAGVTCFLYLLLTGRWRWLFHAQIPQGLLIGALLIIPWHFGMWLKDGRPFIQQYFMTHLWNRATSGVHGERGTFDFYTSQIGIGMFPWVALLPAAVAAVISNVTGKTREGRVRLIVGIWAIFSVAFFSLVQTKFHHYIFPAVPALAILVAFWLDDLWRGRAGRTAMVALAGIAIVLVLVRDFMGEHKQIIEMFVYRYDRPWPSDAPWSIDLSDWFLGFGIAASVALAVFAARRLRAAGMVLFGGVAIAYAMFLLHVYMPHAAQHWGMRDAFRVYYNSRAIHGLDMRFYTPHQVDDEWGALARAGGGEYEIESVIPRAAEDLEAVADTITGLSGILGLRQPDVSALRGREPGIHVGKQMTIDVTLMRNDDRNVETTVTLTGPVSRIGDGRFWVSLPASEVAKLEPMLARAGGERYRARHRPWKQVDADRLLAWQLYWRGENFWTGDEIWGRTEETRTAFKDTDNKAFLKYLDEHGRPGQQYFVVTESGRANNLRHVLPTPTAKETWQILDTSSNKFTLLSFTL